jgi:hypothetical protein|mmetsp:Transcript_32559/g.54595  ORF Transcript_32559/g.54595 Transcript_32559/m.54595 type:complete len:97 (+) Transcript_32559:812-1102(+)
MPYNDKVATQASCIEHTLLQYIATRPSKVQGGNPRIAANLKDARGTNTNGPIAPLHEFFPRTAAEELHPQSMAARSFVATNGAGRTIRMPSQVLEA